MGIVAAKLSSPNSQYPSLMFHPQKFNLSNLLSRHSKQRSHRSWQNIQTVRLGCNFPNDLSISTLWGCHTEVYWDQNTCARRLALQKAHSRMHFFTPSAGRHRCPSSPCHHVFTLPAGLSPASACFSGCSPGNKHTSSDVIGRPVSGKLVDQFTEMLSLAP